MSGVVPPPSAAEEFARRRLERHDRARRRFALAAVVLVVVGAVAVGLLVAYGLGGGQASERDAEGRLVPPSGLTLDEPGARDLVADGTWPGEARIAGMPSGGADRIRWLLSEVAWDEDQARSVGQGLREAAGSDADLAAATVVGVAGTTRPLLPEVRDDVAAVLDRRTEAVAAALAGEATPADQPKFEQGDLLVTLAAVGPEAARTLEPRLARRMRTTWEDAFPDPGAVGPGAARRFSEGFAAQFRRSAQPVVLLHVAMAAPGCGDGVDGECRTEVTRRTARADDAFAQVVLDSIPRELLPPAVRRGLSADPSGARDLTPAAARAWERFRQQQGYGITGPVLDALAR